MIFLTSLLLLPAIQVSDAPGFSKKLQVRAITATVHIVNKTKKSEGSGVVVGKNGPFVYVLTACHLVQGADQLEIATFSEQSYPNRDTVYRAAKVVAKTEGICDLALVRMVANDRVVSFLPLCPIADIPKGEGFGVLAVGCMDGHEPRCVFGEVRGKKRIGHKTGAEFGYFWELGNAVRKGTSGGPLVDKRGFVVGICSGTNDGKTYFVHPAEIHRFLKQNVFDWLFDKENTAPQSWTNPSSVPDWSAVLPRANEERVSNPIFVPESAKYR